MTTTHRRGAQGCVYDYETTYGKRWAFSVDAGRFPNGNRRQISRKGFKLKGDAQEALNKLLAKIHDGTAVDDSTAVVTDRITFGEAFTRWMETQGALERWAITTQEQNRQRAQYAIKMFGDVPLVKLGQQVERLQGDFEWLRKHGGLNGRPLSAKTVYNVAQLVSQYFERAVALERLKEHPLIKQNPMKLVELPTIPKVKAKMPTPEQFEDLLRRTEGTRYFAMIALAAQVGLRRGELLALKLSDLDLRNGKVTTTKSLCQTKKYGLRVKSTKNTKDRKLALAPGTIDALVAHLEIIERDRKLLASDYHDNGLVFCTPEGDYYSPAQITNRITEFMAKAGFKSSLHQLRHFAGSFLLSHGLSLAAVGEILGHADPSVTARIYLHAMPGDNEKAAALWHEAFGQKGKEPKGLAVVSGAYVTTNVTTASKCAPKLFKVKG